jgi:hypothetical protein
LASNGYSIIAAGGDWESMNVGRVQVSMMHEPAYARKRAYFSYHAF